MVTISGCSGRKENGQACRAPKLRDSEYCLMHSPDHAEEVAEARRLGGLRRRREVAVVGAYELGGLDTVVDLRRILEIALLDTLSLDNSIARARTLGYLVGVAAKLLEVGELEQRLAYLEAAILEQKALAEPVFDAEITGGDFSPELADE